MPERLFRLNPRIARWTSGALFLLITLQVLKDNTARERPLWPSPRFSLLNTPADISNRTYKKHDSILVLKKLYLVLNWVLPDCKYIPLEVLSDRGSWEEELAPPQAIVSTAATCSIVSVPRIA